MMRLGFLFLLLPLAACAVGEDYALPQLSLPDSWKSLAQAAPKNIEPEQAPIPLNDWWKQFNDPVLDELMTRALAGNRDLKIAEGRVREARANRIGAIAPLLPDVGASGTASRGSQGFLSGNKPINLYEAGFDASWEIDLFGGNRRRLEASEALAKASEARRGEIMLSLIAEVARNYIEARNAQSQVAIAERNAGAQKAAMELTRSQQSAGLASDLDVSQAEAQHLATQARIPIYKTMQEAAQNRLSTLIGEAPGAVDGLLAETKPVPVLSSAMILATPAAAIATRPDVYTAERELAAAAALTSAAIANRYPKISLSGLFGLQNTSILPGTTLWNVGAQLTAPVIDFGRFRSQVDAADARQLQAAANYEQAVLLALEEIETSLTRYLNEETRRASLQQAAESNRRTVTLADERYRRGIASFHEVLAAERSLYEAESALAQSQAAVSLDAVALYKALGGGATPPGVEDSSARTIP